MEGLLQRETVCPHPAVDGRMVDEYPRVPASALRHDGRSRDGPSTRQNHVIDKMGLLEVSQALSSSSYSLPQRDHISDRLQMEICDRITRLLRSSTLLCFSNASFIATALNTTDSSRATFSRPFTGELLLKTGRQREVPSGLPTDASVKEWLAL